MCFDFNHGDSYSKENPSSISTSEQTLAMKNGVSNSCACVFSETPPPTPKGYTEGPASRVTTSSSIEDSFKILSFLPDEVALFRAVKKDSAVVFKEINDLLKQNISLLQKRNTLQVGLENACCKREQGRALEGCFI